MTPLSLWKWRFCSFWPLDIGEPCYVMSFSFTTSLSREITIVRFWLLSVRGAIFHRVALLCALLFPRRRGFYFNSSNCERRDAFVQGHARRRSLNKSIKSAKEREHTCREKTLTYLSPDVFACNQSPTYGLAVSSGGAGTTNQWRSNVFRVRTVREVISLASAQLF